jgi:hypothetical protein
MSDDGLQSSVRALVRRLHGLQDVRTGGSVDAIDPGDSAAAARLAG